MVKPRILPKAACRWGRAVSRFDILGCSRAGRPIVVVTLRVTNHHAERDDYFDAGLARPRWPRLIGPTRGRRHGFGKSTRCYSHGPCRLAPTSSQTMGPT